MCPTIPIFAPELLRVRREGYGPAAFRADALAGLTVAVVALPLSMAIAIACGVGPERGLITAIVGGGLVSLLGGSRFQIGGPAGAFIVLVAATLAEHGIDGLILATFLSGFLLAAAGACRLGAFIRTIPHPVTIGFTAGIAAIIAVSQLRELLGVRLPDAGPDIPAQLAGLAGAAAATNPWAVLLGLATIAAILGLRRWRPHWPGLLIAIGLAAVVTALIGLPVETVASRFGALPAGLPPPSLPSLDPLTVLAVLPNAVSFALLGAIESLLSAVVADAMSGQRHNPDTELIAQGIANVASAIFGGFCVTGTVARTATNVRAGAHGPLAGVCHALFLLAALLVAMPLAGYLPLAALAGLLLVVAWGMAERRAVGLLLRGPRADAAVLLATFGITLLHDLTAGILVGCAIAGLATLRRLAEEVTVELPLPYPRALATDPEIVVCRISGAVFFAAAAAVGAVLERVGAQPRACVLDLAAVRSVDSTAAVTLEGFVRQVRRHGAQVVIAGAAPPIRRALQRHGLRAPEVRYRPDVPAAVAAARDG